MRWPAAVTGRASINGHSHTLKGLQTEITDPSNLKLGSLPIFGSVRTFSASRRLNVQIAAAAVLAITARSGIGSGVFTG